MTNGQLTTQLTELQRTRLENFALRYTLMQQNITQVQNERAAFIHQLEAEHPGYKWDEQNGLVASTTAVMDNIAETSSTPQ